MKLAFYSFCLCLSVYNVGRWGTALIYWLTDRALARLLK